MEYSRLDDMRVVMLVRALHAVYPANLCWSLNIEVQYWCRTEARNSYHSVEKARFACQAVIITPY
jgi:hypothetical protein